MRGVKHAGDWAGAWLGHPTAQVAAPRRPTKLHSLAILPLPPCVPHVKAKSFTCCLFLQVPDFNSLLSSHLILQASGICKHNIDVYLFPQAPLELTPEFPQPYLMTAWRWQRGEQPLARSILCDWFQHPNPVWVEDYESLLRIATALQPAVRELDSQKEREFRLASFLPHFLLMSFVTALRRLASLHPIMSSLVLPLNFIETLDTCNDGRAEWHCAAIRHFCDWARTFSPSVLAFTQLACTTLTARLDNPPQELCDAWEVSEIRRPCAVVPQLAAMQLCSAW